MSQNGESRGWTVPRVAGGANFTDRRPWRMYNERQRRRSRFGGHDVTACFMGNQLSRRLGLDIVSNHKLDGTSSRWSIVRSISVPLYSCQDRKLVIKMKNIWPHWDRKPCSLLDHNTIIKCRSLSSLLSFLTFYSCIHFLQTR